MSASDVPEHLKQYFGHDKVSIYGVGPLPAAPPAPPGSTARKAGDHAVADALSRVGSSEYRPGMKPAVLPPKPQLKRAVRQNAERASMVASQRRLTGQGRGIAPLAHVGKFWTGVFVPFYRLVPWVLRRPMMRIASGVKGWASNK
jgi:hypothetical protein